MITFQIKKSYLIVNCGATKICIKLQKNWLNKIWKIKNFDKISLKSACDENLAFVSYKEDIENLTLCSELQQKRFCESSKHDVRFLNYFNLLKIKIIFLIFIFLQLFKKFLEI